MRPAARTYFDVITHDARYRVTDFAVTDSTLVIKEVEFGPRTYPAREEHQDRPPTLPYSIPLSEIESVQRVQNPPASTGVLLALGASAAIVIGVIALFQHALGDVSLD